MKKFYVFLLASMLCITAKAQIPTNGLIGYWPFTGNPLDMSGNGNNGTNNGATLSVDRFGNPYSAYYFNGISNYIVLNNNLPIINSPQFTISAWAIMYGLGGGTKQLNNIFEQRCDDGSTSAKSTIHLTAEENTGNASFLVRSSVNSLGNYIEIQSPSKGYGAWHNYIGVLDASSNLRFYIDGIQVGQTPFTQTGDFITDINYVDIGSYHYSGVFNGYFNGNIDEVRIYNRGLSQSEITAIYTETSGIYQTTYQNNVKVFPNPTFDNINVELTTFKNNELITILNIQGEMLQQIPMLQNKIKVDIKNLASGIYFLKLTTSDGDIVSKFIKD